MGSDEAFCLKWNDFPGSITSSLGSLRSPLSPLQDVTLQCGGESVQAHRLVLALCSEWFRTVLESLPASAQHPVLVLWDASPADMSLLCDFMYFGQVNVQQDRLPRAFQEPVGILPSDYSPKGIPSGGGECPYCQKWIQTSVKRHVEDRHLPRPTPCTVCAKVFSSGNKMRAHRSYAHRHQPLHTLHPAPV